MSSSTVPKPGGPGSQIRGSDILLVLILGLVSLRLIALFARSALEPYSVTFTALSIVTLQSLAFIAAVWLVVVYWRNVSWADLGLRPTTQRWLARGLWLALLAFPITLAINWVLQTLFGAPTDNPQLNIVAADGFSWPTMIGMLVVVGGLVPFAEELVFRGLFYGWLRARWNRTLAVGVSAACFALMHGIPWLIPVLLVLGVMFALLYERSGSLWPPILMHGAFNSITVIIVNVALAKGVAFA